LEVIHLDFW